MRVNYETMIAPCSLGGFEVSCPDLAPGVTWPARDEASAAAGCAWVVSYYAHLRIAAGEALPSPLFGHEVPGGGFVMSVSLDVDSDDVSLPGWCTVSSAAEMLCVSTSRVRALARAGRLESKKQGGVWYISLDAVCDRIEHPRRPGRPPKSGGR